MAEKYFQQLARRQPPEIGYFHWKWSGAGAVCDVWEEVGGALYTIRPSSISSSHFLTRLTQCGCKG